MEPALGFFSGTLSVPTIWAEPNSVVTWGTTMRIWCQGTFGALEYHVDKEGNLSPLYRQTSLKHKGKVNFTISFLADCHGGLYHCYLSPAHWSELSNPQELVVTGKGTLGDLSPHPPSCLLPLPPLCVRFLKGIVGCMGQFNHYSLLMLLLFFL